MMFARVRQQLLATRKYIRSFFRSDWRLADYPVVVRYRPAVDRDDRFDPPQWTAQIVNWWQLRGDGITREDAIDQLRERFESFRNDVELPRPGTGLPLEIGYASRDEIVQLENLAREFFPRVLDLSYDDCFISDQSSLWDFHSARTNAPYEQKIRDEYGIDASDISSGNLVEILRRIEER